MKKKGQSGIIILVLILIIAIVIFIYPLGGGKKADEFYKKLKCPPVDEKIQCTFGVELYTNAEGCPAARCALKEQANGPSELPEESSLQVFYLDVGEGNGIYIKTPTGKRVLIDAGPDSSLVDYLHLRGVTKIDWLISTNTNPDSMTGIPLVFKDFVVLNYVSPNYDLCTNTLCNQVKDVTTLEEGLKIHRGKTGFDFPGLEMSWKVLTPDDPPIFEDQNDNSLVVKLNYNEVTFLFPANCERRCEEMLLLLEKDLKANVLMIPHHASGTATSGAYLAKVMPAFAVISLGDSMANGFPSKDVLDRLIKEDINTVKTSVAGNIEIRTDGQKMEFHCEKIPDCFNKKIIPISTVDRPPAINTTETNVTI
jgi:beta-lactamase superfamily II metal-dependent hydrolase